MLLLYLESMHRCEAQEAKPLLEWIATNISNLQQMTDKLIRTSDELIDDSDEFIDDSD